jgi:hypothetical protein
LPAGRSMRASGIESSPFEIRWKCEKLVWEQAAVSVYKGRA